MPELPYMVGKKGSYLTISEKFWLLFTYFYRRRRGLCRRRRKRRRPRRPICFWAPRSSCFLFSAVSVHWQTRY